MRADETVTIIAIAAAPPVHVHLVWARAKTSVGIRDIRRSTFTPAHTPHARSMDEPRQAVRALRKRSMLRPMSKAKKLSLEEHADQIRAELKVPRQGDLFKAAVEAGYLTARADGGVDETELDVLAKAVELLSQG